MASVYRSCAYVEAVQEAVSFALSSGQRELFEEHERALLAAFATLPPDSARILARLLMRRSTWIRPASLTSYLLPPALDQQQQQEDRSRLGEALEVLISSSLLETFLPQASLDVTWEVVYRLCKLNEVSDLLLSVSKGLKGVSRTKDSLFRHLQQTVATQKTCFGPSLAERFPKMVYSYLARDKDAVGIVAVRLAPAVSRLYRRAQRLFQLPSSLPRGSVNEPLEAVAPLMVTFRLMRFASYPLDRGCDGDRRRQRMNVGSSDEEGQQLKELEKEKGGAEEGMLSSLFPTRLAFLQWEAAVELQAMIEKAILPPLRRLEEVVEPFAHSQMLSLFDPRPHSLVDLVREDFAPMLQREEKDAVAKDEGEVVVILGLLALLCLVSLSLQPSPQQTEREQEEEKEREEEVIDLTDDALPALCSPLGVAASLTTHALESHALEDAATILARLVHTFGNEIEKAPRKQYSLAVACFELLLLLRLRPHRRGKFYQRLVVDYNHLGQTQLVIGTLRRGLDDPLLMESDENDLRGRLHAISSRPSSSQKEKKRKSIKSHLSDGLDDGQEDRVCSESAGGSERDSTFLVVMQQVAARGGAGDADSKFLLPLVVVLLREAVRHYLPKRRCGLALKPRARSASLLRCIGWACARCTFYHNTSSTTTSGASSVLKVCLMCGFEEMQLLQEEAEKKGEVKVVAAEEEEERRAILALLPPSTSTNYTIASSTTMEDVREMTVLQACLEILPPGSSPSLNVFFLSGRRFNSSSTTSSVVRTGKSRFCGRDDNLLSVEGFVMEALRHLDPDEQLMDLPLDPRTIPGVSSQTKQCCRSYAAVARGGGWQGWHCEGSVLRTLCGLLLLDIFFANPSTFSPASRGGGGAIFLTPYQDRPLDFPGPLFFSRREQLIMDRVRWLRESTPTSLLAEIGRLYRLYHEVNCSIVNWGAAALPVLQLTARCIGGPGLGLLCYALARDYEQFRAGAPDLLLLRVQRKNKSIDSIEASERGEGNDNGDGSWQTVPLEELLGPNWSTASLRDRQNKNEEEEENWMLSAPSLKRSRTDMLPIDGNTQKKKSKQEDDGEESDGTEEEKTSPDEAKRAADPIVDLDLSPLYGRNGCEWDEKTVCFECLCVEVKGPGDRLSPKQVVWLQLLDLAGPHLQSFLSLIEEE